MGDESQHVGLYAQSDVVWMAGVLYLKTIACALKDADAPNAQTSFLYPRKIGTGAFEQCLEFVDECHAYDFLQNGWQRTSVKTLRRNICKGVLGTRSVERLAERMNLDVLLPCRHSLGADFPVPWVGWIPDFQHVRMPEFFSEEEYAARDAQFQALISDASHMLVSSQCSYYDLINRYTVDREKVSIYRFCTLPDDSWFTPDASEVVQRLGLPEKFLIFPSQYWKHKNHWNLFQAIHQLKQSGMSDVMLVLTGHKDDYRNPGFVESLDAFIETHELQDNIKHVGTLPRLDQIQLLRAAVAVVQPSYFEGWSMLVEDCRALGKRVYLSDIPVHREQEYAHSVYFDPDQPEAIAALIREDWDSLEAGVDLEREASARDEVHAISKRNGAQLIKLIEQVRN